MAKISAQKENVRGERSSPENRRDRLLDAALVLFSEFGFYGVAVPRIAERAGISTGLVYNYFDSKEELVNELFWIWKNQLKSYYLNSYPIEKSIQEKFAYIWDRLHQYAEDFPDAFQFIEGHLHASYLSKKCLELEEEVFEIGRIFIREGQSMGVFPDSDPQGLVGFFFGAFVQYFKDTRSSRQKWSRTSSLVIRDLCWVAMTNGKV